MGSWLPIINRGNLGVYWVIIQENQLIQVE